MLATQLAAIEPLPVRYSLEGPAQERWQDLHESVEGADWYYIKASDPTGGLISEFHDIFIGQALFHVYDPRWSVSLSMGDPAEIYIQCQTGHLLWILRSEGDLKRVEEDITGRALRLEISAELADLLKQAWRRAFSCGLTERKHNEVDVIIGLRDAYSDGELVVGDDAKGSLKIENVGCYYRPAAFSIESEIGAIGSAFFICLFSDDPADHAKELAYVKTIAERIIRFSEEERADFVRRGREVDAILRELENGGPSVNSLDPFKDPEPPPPPPSSEAARTMGQKALAMLTALYAEYYEISETEAHQKAMSGVRGRTISWALEAEEAASSGEQNRDPFVIP